MNVRYLFLLALILIFALNCQSKKKEEIQSSIYEVGRYEFGVAYQVFVKNVTAYITGNDGLHIFDIQNPADPKKLSELRLGGPSFAICVENKIVYIDYSSSGFLIIDVINPQDPKFVGEFSEYPGNYEGILIRDNYAFITLYGGDLLIVDISDKSDPKLINTVSIGQGQHDIALHQNYLYCADENNTGLAVFDITDPASPQKVYTLPLDTGGIASIKKNEKLLFLGAYRGGIKVIDISNPQLPILNGTFDDGGESNSVFYFQNYLYVASWNGCIEIIDVHDPWNPFKLTENKNYVPHDVVHDGHYIYLADQDFGLVILEYRPN